MAEQKYIKEFIARFKDILDDEKNIKYDIRGNRIKLEVKKSEFEKVKKEEKETIVFKIVIK